MACRSSIARLALPLAAAATVLSTFGMESGHIIGADIEINSCTTCAQPHLLTTMDPPPPGTYSLEAILTHEAGHFVGLAHSQLAAAVMYAYYEPRPLPLTADDVAGVCAIYPPGGDGSSKGCSCLVAGADRHGGPSFLAALAVGAALLRRRLVSPRLIAAMSSGRREAPREREHRAPVRPTRRRRIPA